LNDSKEKSGSAEISIRSIRNFIWPMNTCIPTPNRFITKRCSGSKRIWRIAVSASDVTSSERSS
jgi:hypothetical protein